MEQNYQKILVGLDGSPQANYAYECAIEIARRNNAKVLAVAILQHQMYDMVGFGNVNEDAMNHLNVEFTGLLNDVKEWAECIDFHDVETEILYGNPKQLLAHILPEKHGVDLIVVGQSGLSAIERFFIGSVSDFVIRQAPCDVMVIAPEKIEEEI